jgi:NADH-quinone oxidoreductase subunit J
MDFSEIVHRGLFLVIALVTVVGAIKVATTRKIIHAAFWLVPVFAGVAGIYLYLDAQFLAAIQVLIYIGAILVLIIFAVTLTRGVGEEDDLQSNGLVAPVVTAAVVLLAALVGAIHVTPWAAPVTHIDEVALLPGVAVTDVSAIGVVLLQLYLIPCEIASVVLLAAMIAAIVLARKDRAATPMSAPAREETVEQERELAGV